MGFFSDVVPDEEWLSAIEITRPQGWGEGPWGEFPWGNEGPFASTPPLVPVPSQHQRCRTLTLQYRHRYAKERFNILSVAIAYRPYAGKIVRQPA
mgnify:FL=1